MQVIQRGASPKSPRSKCIQLVYGTESITILCSSEFTCTKCVMKLNRSRAADTSRTKREIACAAARYSSYRYCAGGLLNHMAIVTKVGVSYDDHMRDDALNLTAFLANVTRLSLPSIFEELHQTHACAV